MSRQVQTLATGMILAAAATRLLPHPANFTPLLAIALFGGARLDDRRAGFAVPVVAMLLSDLGLELIDGRGLHALMPVVYAAMMACVLIGTFLRARPGVEWILAASVGASVLFSIVTNFAVWAMGTLYPRTAAGLVECYLAALPFFRNTLLSTVFYAGALFAGHQAVVSRLHRSGHGA
jgi:hypothetical protein